MARNAAEYARYDRQIRIPEIGEEGQSRIREAKVFLAGLGGLGSISAYYLVAAGVGHLRAVDRDRVRVENLNRQILHRTPDIERYKTDSAAEKLRELNPHCRIETIREEIAAENALELVGDCAIIVDGTDNFETRTVLNRTSVANRVPFVFGGVEGLGGMAGTFVPPETACFECVFPARAVETASPAVLGAVPGLIGSIQALEVIKLIVGIPGTLKGRLLKVRGVDLTFKEIRLERYPDCKVCGSRGKAGR